MSHTESINQLAEGYQFYKARREEYDNGEQNINFRVAPQPLRLQEREREDILNLGQIIVQFLEATQELYTTDQKANDILSFGKPNQLLTNTEPNYLFARPDMILTDNGLKICEIETSPFGLGLSHLLGESYYQTSQDTLHNQSVLSAYVDSRISKLGELVYSNKTQQYAGQLRYTADKIFSNHDKKWEARHIDNLEDSQCEIYRGFYLSEYLNDPKVKDLINSKLQQNSTTPTITPQLEEKVILAMLWDTRFEDFYKQRL